ncbi:MAG: hypothetical protein LC777_06160, partial [Actinobacteria bacterium]|nr:hypothetical protein [Actinomycetota bacterium]
LGPNVPTPLTPPPPPPPKAQTFEDEGLSGLQKVLIFGAAALLLAAIGYVIVRDARRAAPVDRPARAAGGGTSAAAKASMRERERRRAKQAKSKARQARQQRRRNRRR